MNRILVITPTYNERENLPKLAREVLGVAPEANLLVVDDGSPDGTGALADRMSEADPRIQVVHRAGKMGLGSAYVEGFSRALKDDYDYVFEIDADLSHDPRDIPRFVEAMEREGADLVIGSRYVPGGRTV
ncbi:MAG: glycosyltransferase, partial [Candidatus Methylomirabilis sp.]|nr:glycosyltransferase [Deltaproteobacteria bacterium]